MIAADRSNLATTHSSSYLESTRRGRPSPPPRADRHKLGCGWALGSFPRPSHAPGCRSALGRVAPVTRDRARAEPSLKPAPLLPTPMKRAGTCLPPNRMPGPPTRLAIALPGPVVLSTRFKHNSHSDKTNLAPTCTCSAGRRPAGRNSAGPWTLISARLTHATTWRRHSIVQHAEWRPIGRKHH